MNNKKIYLKEKIKFKHRSGWGYALSCLEELNIGNGVLFDSFIEKSFRHIDTLETPLFYNIPWVGVFHIPDNIPRWFDLKQTPREIFKNEYFIKSLEYCKGFYCLSNYEKNIIRKYTDLPISVVFHPTEIPDVKFSFDKFMENKDREIIQLGIFGRKVSSIYLLPVKDIKKSILGIDKRNLFLLALEIKEFDLKINKNDVKVYSFLDNKEYDEVLSKNIIFVDLYDASANNAVIECIVRNTPLLINKHPAVTEYLGEDYPFYFDSLEEAGRKAEDFDLIKKTYEYLLNLKTKEKLTGEYFLESIVNSEIYKNL